MKSEIRKSITAYVPGNLCNMRCSYCYVSECFLEKHFKKPHFDYCMEDMIRAFHPKRFGGGGEIAYITVIGGGETLLPKEVVPFIKGLLDLGHVVEVVTNNTLNERIEDLLTAPKKDLKRLIVKCSLHWNELKRMKKIEDYFSNMKKILASGACAYPFLVIGNDYMPFLDEICSRCMEEIGELPVCTPCVVSDKPEEVLYGEKYKTDPPCTPEFIEEINKKFHSKLFMESVKMLEVNPHEIFCYAGLWSFGVSLDSGEMLKCHNVPTGQNFFEDIKKPLKLEPIGCECGLTSCSLQYQYYGCGCIPELTEILTYSEMIDRPKLFNETVRRMMDVKFYNEQPYFSKEEERLFLMRRIAIKDKMLREQDKLLIEYLKVTRELKEVLKTKEPKSQEMLIEEILRISDENRMDYNSLKNITYQHLKALYQICKDMEKGGYLFKKLYRAIVLGLLRTHSYAAEKEILFYEEGKLPDFVLELPVTIFLSEVIKKEEAEKYLFHPDNMEQALDFFSKQIERVLE